MAVPKMSQLRPGVRVNMVLKTDQRSGRLTTGSISEVPSPTPLKSWKVFYKSKRLLIPFQAVSLLIFILQINCLLIPKALDTDQR